MARNELGSGLPSLASWILSTCLALPAASRSFGGPFAAAAASPAFFVAGAWAFVFDAPALSCSITFRNRGSDSGLGLGRGLRASPGMRQVSSAGFGSSSNARQRADGSGLAIFAMQGELEVTGRHDAPFVEGEQRRVEDGVADLAAAQSAAHRRLLEPAVLDLVVRRQVELPDQPALLRAGHAELHHH